MERFGQNLAQLAQPTQGQKGGGGSVDDSGGGQQKQKWAALRAFLGQTMERDESFT